MRCTAICRITGATELSGLARLRFISNAFTRMRYCFPNGQLDMYAKEAPENAPAPLKPWFAIPGPVSNEYSIAFGHWASLEGRGTPEGIYALDTGCCWGGDLTCLRWEDKQYFTQPSNRQKERTKARRSPPEKSRIAVSGIRDIILPGHATRCPECH
jgi:bis(5'-nucleosyl)-tetraphosphatase (symmetrical)